MNIVQRIVLIMGALAVPFVMYMREHPFYMALDYLGLMILTFLLFKALSSNRIR